MRPETLSDAADDTAATQRVPASCTAAERYRCGRAPAAAAASVDGRRGDDDDDAIASTHQCPGLEELA